MHTRSVPESTRAVLSNGGFVTARMDYTAYGEEIASGVGLRTSAQGFDSAINPRQQYGLTERDDATGLDHTPWRKNENRGGRWTSPDPYNGSISLGDPQSFNRNSKPTVGGRTASEDGFGGGPENLRFSANRQAEPGVTP